MWCFHITFMQKYLLVIGDFELYINFSNLVQQVFLHYNPFKYSFKTSTKIRGGQQEYIILIYAKTQLCPLKNLSETTSFSFWPSWVFSTASLIICALVTMRFLLLVVHPTIPLSPGEWTHWRISSACNDSFQFLPKTGFLRNLR